MLILAIDQGTTNTKGLLVDAAGRVVARAAAALTTQYPQAGWAEQSAADIWTSVRQVIAALAPQGRPMPSPSPISARHSWSGTPQPASRSAPHRSGNAAARLMPVPP